MRPSYIDEIGNIIEKVRLLTLVCMLSFDSNLGLMYRLDRQVCPWGTAPGPFPLIVILRGGAVPPNSGAVPPPLYITIRGPFPMDKLNGPSGMFTAMVGGGVRQMSMLLNEYGKF